MRKKKENIYPSKAGREVRGFARRGIGRGEARGNGGCSEPNCLATGAVQEFGEWV